MSTSANSLSRKNAKLFQGVSRFRTRFIHQAPQNSRLQQAKERIGQSAMQPRYIPRSLALEVFWICGEVSDGGECGNVLGESGKQEVIYPGALGVLHFLNALRWQFGPDAAHGRRGETIPARGGIHRPAAQERGNSTLLRLFADFPIGHFFSLPQ